MKLDIIGMNGHSSLLTTWGLDHLIVIKWQAWFYIPHSDRALKSNQTQVLSLTFVELSFWILILFVVILVEFGRCLIIELCAGSYKPP